MQYDMSAVVLVMFTTMKPICLVFRGASRIVKLLLILVHHEFAAGTTNQARVRDVP
jgi:hypothetical protein